MQVTHVQVGGLEGISSKPVGKGVGVGEGDLRFLNGLSSDPSSNILSPILYIGIIQQRTRHLKK
jgi:hypothetical protein